MISNGKQKKIRQTTPLACTTLMFSFDHLTPLEHHEKHRIDQFAKHDLLNFNTEIAYRIVSWGRFEPKKAS